jgi:hypothetical protein
MYLEPIRAVGREGMQAGFYRVCPQDSQAAGVRMFMEVGRDPYEVCGGVKARSSPPPSFYNLVGTPKSWSYGSCKTGYRRKLSGFPHPNYYGCFKV